MNYAKTLFLPTFFIQYRFSYIQKATLPEVEGVALLCFHFLSLTFPCSCSQSIHLQIVLSETWHVQHFLLFTLAEVNIHNLTELKKILLSLMVFYYIPWWRFALCTMCIRYNLEAYHTTLWHVHLIRIYYMQRASCQDQYSFEWEFKAYNGERF